MGTIPIIKRIFNSGELSAKVYGRTDIERYEGGLKTLQNFVPIPQGGLVRRPGMRYIATARATSNNTGTVRLLPFQFSTTQAYIIEAGNGYMRFYMNGGQILDANNSPYEITTPYAASDLNNLQYSQSFDTMYLYHENYAPRQLTRTAHNNWTLGNVSFVGAPSDWGNNNGWPRTGTFYQDRHVLGSPSSFPQRLYFSKTSNYVDMTTGTNDADGFVINLLSGSSDVIFWLGSHRQLLAGADSGIWSIGSANGSSVAISPTNRKAHKDTYFGSAAVAPAQLGDHWIYIQYLASKVRDLSYSYEADGYTSSETSVLADHLIEDKKVTHLAYQQVPFELVWMRRNDGTLIALTFMAEHKVIGFSQHVLGGNSPYVFSIACIQGNNESELWLATRRNINNETKTYIERMEPFYFSGMNNAFFVDCGISGSSNSSTVSGLSHLEGQVISYLADGVVGNATVSNGSITISLNSANNITVGLAYNSVIETLPIEAEIQSGPTMFKVKRITELAVRCRNSAGGTYGPDSSNQTRLMNNNALFSGDITNLSIRGGHNTNKTVMVRQSDPLPMALDAIGLEVEVE